MPAAKQTVKPEPEARDLPAILSDVRGVRAEIAALEASIADKLDKLRAEESKLVAEFVAASNAEGIILGATYQASSKPRQRRTGARQRPSRNGKSAEAEAKVVAYLKDNPGVPARVVREAIGPDADGTVFARLNKAGTIKREGNTRSAVWSVA